MRSKVTERTLLFVEDDLNLLYEMTNWFRAAGNTVHAADTLEKAEKAFARTTVTTCSF